MFRRLPNSLPKDTEAVADLEKLGYFVGENDQVRQIRNPAQGYQFRFNRSERVNEVYKEAMNTCMRKIVLERLCEKGLEELRVPIGASQSENHLPILVSKGIETKHRVLVIFPDRQYDLGILSYRIMGEEGINMGSLVGFVGAVLNNSATASEDTPGLVIANPSQTIWCRSLGKAMNIREWLALPRPSAVHEAMRIDEVRNRVPQNKDYIEHVEYIFEHVLQKICHAEAQFDIIGLEYTGSAATHYLVDHWKMWEDRITGIALVNPQHSFQDLIAERPKSTTFEGFVRRRSRAYFVSEKPLDTLVEGRDRFGCNCYSSGEVWYEESAFIRCWKSILSWFAQIHSADHYSEPTFQISTWVKEHDDREQQESHNLGSG